MQVYNNLAIIYIYNWWIASEEKKLPEGTRNKIKK